MLHLVIKQWTPSETLWNIFVPCTKAFIKNAKQITVVLYIKGNGTTHFQTSFLFYCWVHKLGEFIILKGWDSRGLIIIIQFHNKPLSKQIQYPQSLQRFRSKPLPIRKIIFIAIFLWIYLYTSVCVCIQFISSRKYSPPINPASQ